VKGSELRKVPFLAPSPSVYGILFVYEISRVPLDGFASNFGPSLGRVWGPRSKVNGQGHRGKKSFFGPLGDLRAVYVWWNIFSL